MLKRTFLILFIPLALLNAQDFENIEQVGRIFNFWTCALGAEIDGHYAYVATGYSGISILDASDLENPVEAGFCDTPGFAEDIAVEGGFAYVADCYEGVRVMDVSNPLEPFEVGYCEVPGSALGIAASGTHVFMAVNDCGLYIVPDRKPHLSNIYYANILIQTVRNRFQHLKTDFLT